MMIPISMDGSELHAKRHQLLEVIEDEDSVNNVLLDNKDYINTFLDGDVFEVMSKAKKDVFFAFALKPDIYVVHKLGKKVDIIRFKDIKKNLPYTVAYCVMNAHENNMDSKLIGLLERCLNIAHKKNLI